MNTLTVNKHTKLHHLSDYFREVGDREKLRGKKNKNGDLVLYKSHKGKGTGLKNFLFGKVDQRREAAQLAIMQIVHACEKDEPDQDIANKLMSASFRQGELLAENFKAAFHLPLGVRIDREGNLSGTQKIFQVPVIPKSMSNQMVGNDGKALADVLNDAKIEH